MDLTDLLLYAAAPSPDHPKRRNFPISIADTDSGTNPSKFSPSEAPTKPSMDNWTRAPPLPSIMSSRSAFSLNCDPGNELDLELALIEREICASRTRQDQKGQTGHQLAVLPGSAKEKKEANGGSGHGSNNRRDPHHPSYPLPAKAGFQTATNSEERAFKPIQASQNSSSLHHLPPTHRTSPSETRRTKHGTPIRQRRRTLGGIDPELIESLRNNAYEVDPELREPEWASVRDARNESVEPRSSNPVSRTRPPRSARHQSLPAPSGLPPTGPARSHHHPTQSPTEKGEDPSSLHQTDGPERAASKTTSSLQSSHLTRKPSSPVFLRSGDGSRSINYSSSSHGLPAQVSSQPRETSCSFASLSTARPAPLTLASEEVNRGGGHLLNERQSLQSGAEANVLPAGILNHSTHPSSSSSLQHHPAAAAALETHITPRHHHQTSATQNSSSYLARLPPSASDYNVRNSQQQQLPRNSAAAAPGVEAPELDPSRYSQHFFTHPSPPPEISRSALNQERGGFEEGSSLGISTCRQPNAPAEMPKNNSVDSFGRYAAKLFRESNGEVEAGEKPVDVPEKPLAANSLSRKEKLKAESTSSSGIQSETTTKETKKRSEVEKLASMPPETPRSMRRKLFVRGSNKRDNSSPPVPKTPALPPSSGPKAMISDTGLASDEKRSGLDFDPQTETRLSRHDGAFVANRRRPSPSTSFASKLSKSFADLTSGERLKNWKSRLPSVRRQNYETTKREKGREEKGDKRKSKVDDNGHTPASDILITNWHLNPLNQAWESQAFGKDSGSLDKLHAEPNPNNPSKMYRFPPHVTDRGPVATYNRRNTVGHEDNPYDLASGFTGYPQSSADHSSNHNSVPSHYDKLFHHQAHDSLSTQSRSNLRNLNTNIAYPSATIREPRFGSKLSENGNINGLSNGIDNYLANRETKMGSPRLEELRRHYRQIENLATLRPRSGENYFPPKSDLWNPGETRKLDDSESYRQRSRSTFTVNADEEYGIWKRRDFATEAMEPGSNGSRTVDLGPRENRPRSYYGSSLDYTTPSELASYIWARAAETLDARSQLQDQDYLNQKWNAGTLARNSAKKYSSNVEQHQLPCTKAGDLLLTTMPSHASKDSISPRSIVGFEPARRISDVNREEISRNRPATTIGTRHHAYEFGDSGRQPLLTPQELLFHPTNTTNKAQPSSARSVGTGVTSPGGFGLPSQEKNSTTLPSYAHSLRQPKGPGFRNPDFNSPRLNSKYRHSIGVLLGNEIDQRTKKFSTDPTKIYEEISFPWTGSLEAMESRNAATRHQPPPVPPPPAPKNVKGGNQQSLMVSNYDDPYYIDKNYTSLPPPARITPYSGVHQGNEGEIIRPIAFKPVGRGASSKSSTPGQSGQFGYLSSPSPSFRRPSADTGDYSDTSSSLYGIQPPKQNQRNQSYHGFTPPHRHVSDSEAAHQQGGGDYSSGGEMARPTPRYASDSEAKTLGTSLVFTNQGMRSDPSAPTSAYSSPGLAHRSIKAAGQSTPPSSQRGLRTDDEFLDLTRISQDGGQSSTKPRRFPSDTLATASSDFSSISNSLAQPQSISPKFPISGGLSLNPSSFYDTPPSQRRPAPTAHHQDSSRNEPLIATHHSTQNHHSSSARSSSANQGTPGSHGSRQSSGIHVTPSPSDSGVAELEAALREKEGELANLRNSMETNEQIIVRVYQEKEDKWQEKLREWSNRLESSIQTEQRLLSQIQRLQDERAELQRSIQNLTAEKHGLQRKCKEIEGELFDVQGRLDSSEKHWAICRKCGDIFLPEAHKEIVDSNANHHQNGLKDPYEDEGKRGSGTNGGLGGAGFLHACPNYSSKSPTPREELRSELDTLRREVFGLKDSLQHQINAYSSERQRWEDEKQKVVQYQKMLQTNYVNVFQRNQELERLLEKNQIDASNLSSHGKVNDLPPTVPPLPIALGPFQNYPSASDNQDKKDASSLFASHSASMNPVSTSSPVDTAVKANFNFGSNKDGLLRTDV